ncbi:NERD domain-containing protein [Bacillus marinisedimentorum]|uniref:NERD domain-containing protein n=1 Tax=Bacillus marinisedimentorum TaxID=1821260 RepID=UPI00087280EA|nr:NERD domain-containing protein [Bacillus marinisedimentorum]
MAQLIKLQDYISRYEKDIYRYPGQFISHKQKRWQSFKAAWEEGLPLPEAGAERHDFFEQWETADEPDRKGPLSTIKTLLKRSAVTMEESSKIPHSAGSVSEEELKERFRDEMLGYKMRWGTSTLREKSSVDRNWNKNVELIHLLQGFPDSYLLMHKPVFRFQQATVELDTILVTPVDVIVMTHLQGSGQTVFKAAKGKFWQEQTGKDIKKRLNPMISLDRSARIISRILSSASIALPVQKVLYSRRDRIDFPYPPAGLKVLDKSGYPEWRVMRVRQPVPLKHMQLKAARELLLHCETVAYRRPEWEIDE